MSKSCFLGDKIGHAKSVSLNGLSRLFDKVGVDQCPGECYPASRVASIFPRYDLSRKIEGDSVRRVGECGRANRLSGKTTTFQFEISQDHMVFQEETNTIIVIVFLACPGV